MAEAVIALEAVTREYRRGESTIRAIDNVTLAIGPGEFVAVMG